MPRPALKHVREVYRKVLGGRAARLEAELLSRLPFEAPGVLQYILVYHFGSSEVAAKETIGRLRQALSKYGLVPEDVEARRRSKRKKEEALGGILKPRRPVKRI